MPAIIGNASHAQMAFSHVTGKRNDSDTFKRIGAGAFRVAVLHLATKVVYKVEHRDGDGYYDNKMELRNARALRRICYDDGWWTDRVRIPKVSGFKVNSGKSLVIAMEFIEGTLGYDTPNVHPDAHANLRWLGLGDMHGKNYIVDKQGIIYPVDLASGRNTDPKNFKWPEEWEAEARAEQAKWEAERVIREARWEEQRREAQRVEDERVRQGFCRCGCGERASVINRAADVERQRQEKRQRQEREAMRRLRAKLMA